MAATLKPDEELDNFNRHPKRDIFDCIFFGLTVRFLAVMIGVF
jgi:hypothetical protein